MIEEFILQTPCGDYELLDFGEGRILERYGDRVIDRPARLAKTPRSTSWDADWVYSTHAAVSSWHALRTSTEPEWQLEVEGQTLWVRLYDHGDLGLRPEYLACAQWIEKRLSGLYHLKDLNVLNLFGGSGLLSALALKAGAHVTHVDSVAEDFALAQKNIRSKDIEFVFEDPYAYVEQAIRGQQRFDMILMHPPLRQKGPNKRSWDIKCDLGPMVSKLPRLLKESCQGIWLAPLIEDLSVESVAQFLRDILPGRTLHRYQIQLSTADGRRLPAGIAACVYDEEEMEVESGTRPPLSAEKIEVRLDVFLDAVLSSRRTASGPARELAKFSRAEQEFVLHWVEVVSRSNAEMAYQFAAYAADALQRMPIADVQDWLLRAMDVFDSAGFHAGVGVLKEVEQFASLVEARKTGVDFHEVATILEFFIHGLNGRRLKLESGVSAHTDTETIFLPEKVNLFDDKSLNFRLYKAMAVYQWAQCWFGTWRRNLLEVLQGQGDEHGDPESVLLYLQRLEAIRLGACIERQLPGMYRVIGELLQQRGESMVPFGWEPVVARLRDVSASVDTSIALLGDVLALPAPTPLCYQGTMNPVLVEQVKAMRKEKDANALRRAVYKLQDDIQKIKAREGADTGDEVPEWDLRIKLDSEKQDIEMELLMDGQPIAPPEEVKAIASSIWQDFGEIPPEYLVAAGDGAYAMDSGDKEDKSQDVWSGTYHEEGALLYNEWDFKRQTYRKNWCVLREIDVRPQSVEFFARTMRRHGGLIHQIRRTFEILRGEDKLLKKQPFGDDVDIDAIVEAYGDVSSGHEMTDCLFLKKHKVERNIAVMFMVDMSGSTKGWINDAERESLILLCEALEVLGDRYAIYGFSGNTRKRCELYRIKGFAEGYDDTIKGRICGILPQDYTRMGVTIRHLTVLLNEIEARTKLLITLSDGKPDDFDGYRGEYGIEDTRQALIEAKRSGIHPFCITIDKEAGDYLPHMYGAVNYTVIDEVRKLPMKVSDIYRRLTS